MDYIYNSKRELPLSRPFFCDCSLDHLVGNDPKKYNSSYDGKLQGVRDLHQGDEHLQGHHESRSNDHPKNASFPTPEAATSQNGSGNGIQLEEVAV